MLLLIAACGPTLGLKPGDPLPDRLSDLPFQTATDVFPYTPEWPLWSDGLDKERFVYLPPGTHIKTAGLSTFQWRQWQWPDGALLLKTFSLDGEPVETRGLYRVDGEWEYAVWQWADGDATRLSLLETVPVEGAAHTIPDRLACRLCHEVGGGVLGFQPIQIADFSDYRSLFGELPRNQPLDAADPGMDAATREVFGGFVGNCVHCHNGLDGDGHSFDLSPPVALENTLNVSTSSATAAGTRIVPGSPEQSVLFLAVSGEHDDPEIRSMPPLGVDVRDAAQIERLRAWINDL